MEEQTHLWCQQKHREVQPRAPRGRSSIPAWQGARAIEGTQGCGELTTLQAAPGGFSWEGQQGPAGGPGRCAAGRRGSGRAGAAKGTHGPGSPRPRAEAQAAPRRAPGRHTNVGQHLRGLCSGPGPHVRFRNARTIPPLGSKAETQEQALLSAPGASASRLHDRSLETRPHVPSVPASDPLLWPWDLWLTILLLLSPLTSSLRKSF